MQEELRRVKLTTYSKVKYIYITIPLQALWHFTCFDLIKIVE